MDGGQRISERNAEELRVKTNYKAVILNLFRELTFHRLKVIRIPKHVQDDGFVRSITVKQTASHHRQMP